MAIRLEELYEQDFYLWTQRQAQALRHLAETRPNIDLDLPHLIEEVEDLGTSQRDAVRSQVRRIIEHCLKLEFSRTSDPRGGWYDSIIDARGEIEDKLSPSLRRDLEEQLPRLWARARAKSDNGMRRSGSQTPPTCCPPTAPTRSTTCWPTIGTRPTAAASRTIADSELPSPADDGAERFQGVRPWRLAGCQSWRSRSARR
jgi:hypothetical protein